GRTGGYLGSAPEVSHDRLTRCQPGKIVYGNCEARCTDILAERKKVLMGTDIIDCVLLSIIDLDLLYTRVGLDINQMAGRGEFFVKVVRTAEINGTISFLVKVQKRSPFHAGDCKRFLITGAIGPAALEPILYRKLSNGFDGIGIIFRNIESCWVIWIV